MREIDEMQLMSPTEFCNKYYDDYSRPARSTVYRWLRDGKLPGVKIGRCMYVDIEKFEAQEFEGITPPTEPLKQYSKESLQLSHDIDKILGK